MIWINFTSKSISETQRWTRLLWRGRWTPIVVLWCLLFMLLLVSPAVAQDGVCQIVVPPDETWQAKYWLYFNTSSLHDPCTRGLYTTGWTTLGPGQYDVPVFDGVVYVLWMIRPLPWDTGPGAVNEQWYVECGEYPGRLGVCIFDDGFEGGTTIGWSKVVP